MGLGDGQPSFDIFAQVVRGQPDGSGGKSIVTGKGGRSSAAGGALEGLAGAGGRAGAGAGADADAGEESRGGEAPPGCGAVRPSDSATEARPMPGTLGSMSEGVVRPDAPACRAPPVSWNPGEAGIVPAAEAG